jgi:hypothetical protein
MARLLRCLSTDGGLVTLGVTPVTETIGKTELATGLSLFIVLGDLVALSVGLN